MSLQDTLTKALAEHSSLTIQLMNAKEDQDRDSLKSQINVSKENISILQEAIGLTAPAKQNNGIYSTPKEAREGGQSFRRSASPRRKRSLSPRRKRSLSPRIRNPSPIGRRNPSPRRSGNSSPRRRRDPSPRSRYSPPSRRRRSPSPRRRRSPSPRRGYNPPNKTITRNASSIKGSDICPIHPKGRHTANECYTRLPTPSSKEHYYRLALQDPDNLGCPSHPDDNHRIFDCPQPLPNFLHLHRKADEKYPICKYCNQRSFPYHLYMCVSHPQFKGPDRFLEEYRGAREEIVDQGTVNPIHIS